MPNHAPRSRPPAARAPRGAASKPRTSRPSLEFHPVTPGRWADLERLFGPRGACGGCWCMWFRLTRAEFEKGKGEPNRCAMRRIVDSGEVPGILAYAGGEPVAWCSIGPRERYPLLERSRVARRLDGERVWSAVCFFVARAWRGKGVTAPLLEAAVRFAASRGARIVEGYPIEPAAGRTPEAFAYYGLASTFRAAGFSEVARRTPGRPYMRRLIERAK